MNDENEVELQESEIIDIDKQSEMVETESQLQRKMNDKELESNIKKNIQRRDNT